MRVALVGFGSWGRHHARILSRHGWLTALVEPDDQRREEARRLYPSLQVCLSMEELPWSTLGAVVIASPVDQHVLQAELALSRGSHCFVEKPLALDVDSVRQLANQARSANRVLMTGHILDYHPATEQIITACHQGVLGDLLSVHAARSRLVPPRRYLSVIHELLWHDLSLLLRIVGRQPERVHTIGDMEQEGMLILDFGGIRATLRGSQRQALRESQFLVGGTQGAFLFDDEAPWTSKLRYQANGGPSQLIPLMECEPLEVELKHFVAVAEGRGTPRSGPDEAIDILLALEKVTDACLTAAI